MVGKKIWWVLIFKNLVGTFRSNIGIDQNKKKWTRNVGINNGSIIDRIILV